MRLRMSFLAFLLGTAVVPIMAVPQAAAQKAPAGLKANATGVRGDVRKLHNLALKKLRAGKIEEAYSGFLEAWNLQKIPKIAGNLAIAELQLGKYRDAAEHVSLYLREGKNIAPGDEKKARAELKQAKAKVGTLRVETAQAGAEVFVDGASVGTTPIDHELYVEPGKHEIEARLGNLRAAESLDAAAGVATTKTLTLAPPKKSEPPGPGAPARDAPVADDSKPFPVQKVVLAGSAGLAAAGIVTGLGLLVASGDKRREMDAALYRLSGKPGQNADRRCGPAYAKEICDDIRTKARQRDSLGNGGIAALVLGSAVAAGTLGYLLGKEPQKTTGVRLLPAVGPTEGRLMVIGTW